MRKTGRHSFCINSALQNINYPLICGQKRIFKISFSLLANLLGDKSSVCCLTFDLVPLNLQVKLVWVYFSLWLPKMSHFWCYPKHRSLLWLIFPSGLHFFYSHTVVKMKCSDCSYPSPCSVLGIYPPWRSGSLFLDSRIHLPW